MRLVVLLIVLALSLGCHSESRTLPPDRPSVFIMHDGTICISYENILVAERTYTMNPKNRCGTYADFCGDNQVGCIPGLYKKH